MTRSAAQVRLEITQLAKAVAHKIGLKAAEVHRACNRKLGVSQADASLVQLRSKKEFLERKLRHLQGTHSW